MFTFQIRSSWDSDFPSKLKTLHILTAMWRLPRELLDRVYVVHWKTNLERRYVLHFFSLGSEDIIICFFNIYIYIYNFVKNNFDTLASMDNLWRREEWNEIHIDKFRRGGEWNEIKIFFKISIVSDDSLNNVTFIKHL